MLKRDSLSNLLTKEIRRFSQNKENYSYDCAEYLNLCLEEYKKNIYDLDLINENEECMRELVNYYNYIYRNYYENVLNVIENNHKEKTYANESYVLKLDLLNKRHIEALYNISIFSISDKLKYYMLRGEIKKNKDINEDDKIIEQERNNESRTLKKNMFSNDAIKNNANLNDFTHKTKYLEKNSKLYTNDDLSSNDMKKEEEFDIIKYIFYLIRSIEYSLSSENGNLSSFYNCLKIYFFRDTVNENYYNNIYLLTLCLHCLENITSNIVTFDIRELENEEFNSTNEKNTGSNANMQRINSLQGNIRRKYSSSNFRNQSSSKEINTNFHQNSVINSNNNNNSNSSSNNNNHHNGNTQYLRTASRDYSFFRIYNNNIYFYKLFFYILNFLNFYLEDMIKDGSLLYSDMMKVHAENNVRRNRKEQMLTSSNTLSGTTNSTLSSFIDGKDELFFLGKNKVTYCNILLKCLNIINNLMNLDILREKIMNSSNDLNELKIFLSKYYKYLNEYEDIEVYKHFYISLYKTYIFIFPEELEKENYFSPMLLFENIVNNGNIIRMRTIADTLIFCFNDKKFVYFFEENINITKVLFIFVTYSSRLLSNKQYELITNISFLFYIILIKFPNVSITIFHILNENNDYIMKYNEDKKFNSIFNNINEHVNMLFLSTIHKNKNLATVISLIFSKLIHLYCQFCAKKNNLGSVQNNVNNNFPYGTHLNTNHYSLRNLNSSYMNANGQNANATVSNLSKNANQNNMNYSYASNNENEGSKLYKEIFCTTFDNIKTNERNTVIKAILINLHVIPDVYSSSSIFPIEENIEKTRYIIVIINFLFTLMKTQFYETIHDNTFEYIDYFIEQLKKSVNMKNIKLVCGYISLLLNYSLNKKTNNLNETADLKSSIFIKNIHYNNQPNIIKIHKALYESGALTFLISSLYESKDSLIIYNCVYSISFLLYKKSILDFDKNIELSNMKIAILNIVRHYYNLDKYLENYTENFIDYKGFLKGNPKKNLALHEDDSYNTLLNKLNKRNSYEYDDINKKYLYEEDNRYLMNEKNDKYLPNHMNSNYSQNMNKNITSNEHLGNKNMFPLKYQYANTNYENSFFLNFDKIFFETVKNRKSSFNFYFDTIYNTQYLFNFLLHNFLFYSKDADEYSKKYLLNILLHNNITRSSDINFYSNKIKNLSSQFNESQSRLELYKQDLERYKDVINVLNKEIEEKENAHNALIQKIRKENEIEINRKLQENNNLENIISQKNDIIDELQRKYEEVYLQKKEAEEENVNIKNRTVSMESLLKSLQTKYTQIQTQNKTLNNKLTDQTNRINEGISVINSLTSENEKLKTIEENQNNELEGTFKKLIVVVKELSDKKKEIDEKDKNIKKYSNDIQELKSIINKSDSDLKEQALIIENFTGLNKNLSDELNNANKNLELSKRYIMNYEKNEEEMKNRIMKLEKELYEKNEECEIKTQKLILKEKELSDKEIQLKKIASVIIN
ncbi:hypothetical protein POVCU2_0042320 [Plasmodium ovale curtisi]|uniref:t-SNARE coiled-coil homology domain-containing protein n=1 Tax=Plasmodium ovale curtisi TaxID=864141 RepID=A0A1A8W5U5_PLAOA|nr:hypothetical protein POVCU2_0042320 [Plasmodium ovale curtisi]SBS97546.1 hypothetical protein POVCU1_039050 [Plasmodium ovale curtisi]